ncbi:TetR family transcriptional regulator [Streptomyces sp. NPDC057486]|uniref:TetR family transcriptional regulator n=1 Tax=Streptomyces sp. NPDC057486 TaxID=3346145 RepID=UPI00368D1DDA
MARDATATRERLLDATTKVFAAQGMEQVNLRDINRAAGQSNNSALHYQTDDRVGHHVRQATPRAAETQNIEHQLW